MVPPRPIENFTGASVPVGTKNVKTRYLVKVVLVEDT